MAIVSSNRFVAYFLGNIFADNTYDNSDTTENIDIPSNNVFSFYGTITSFTPYRAVSPYITDFTSDIDNWLINAKQGFSYSYPAKYDITNYTFTPYFLRVTPSGSVWNLSTTQAVNASDLWEVIKNASTNGVTVRIKSNVTAQDVIDKWVNRTSGNTNISYLALWISDEEPSQTITVTNTDNTQGFTNKTLLPSTIDKGVDYTISMSAIDGYTVTSTPHIIINDGTANLVDSDLTLSGGIYSKTVNISTTATSITATYTGAAISDIIPVTTVDNTEGFINKSFPASLTQGITATASITLPDNFTISTAPYLRIYNQNGDIVNQVNFTRESTTSRVYKASFAVNNPSITSVTIEYYGVARDNRRYLPNVTIADNLINFNPFTDSITLQETVTTNLILTPLEGYNYTIDSPYAIVSYAGDDTTYAGTRQADGTWIIPISVPKFVNLPSATVINLYGEMSQDTELAGINPFVYTYKLDKTAVAELVDVRFAEMTAQGQVSGYIDCANYIINLYKPFVNIEALTDKTSIWLGFLQTDTEGNLVKYASSTINYSVDIRELYHNSIDYESTIKIYLPFHGMRDLSPDDIMGKTLGIVYKIDNTTGQGVIYLYADDKLFDACTCKAYYETPITVIQNGKLTDITKAINDSNDYKDLTIKVYINRAQPLSSNFNNFNEEDCLTTPSALGAGKYSIDSMDISTIATSDEVEMIKRICSNEFIIL